jgi:hypothetical protein
MPDELDYGMQSNGKSREGGRHPDRNAQFEFISATVENILLPMISVDTKQKGLVGSLKNGGQEWEKKGNPADVEAYDFPDKQLDKVSPYGVYDVAHNEGWVSAGIAHDTAEFAGESISRGWLRRGKSVYPSAKKLLIAADGGGGNGVRNRLWKVAFRKLSDELGLVIHMRHFPPVASMRNTIEHQLFCLITEAWRVRPPIDPMTVVNPICHSGTSKGFTIKAELEASLYETGKSVSDEQLAKLRITGCAFHGERNYSFAP